MSEWPSQHLSREVAGRVMEWNMFVRRRIPVININTISDPWLQRKLSVGITQSITVYNDIRHSKAYHSGHFFCYLIAHRGHALLQEQLFPMNNPAKRRQHLTPVAYVNIRCTKFYLKINNLANSQYPISCYNSALQSIDRFTCVKSMCPCPSGEHPLQGPIPLRWQSQASISCCWLHSLA